MSILVSIAIAVPVSISQLQRRRAFTCDHAACLILFEEWDGGQCRQPKDAMDFFTGPDTVIQIFEQRCQTNAKANRKQECQDDPLQAIGTDRYAWRRCIIGYV